MYQKILVAIDSSTLTEQVFEQALALANSLQAKLMLLHVLSMEEEGYPEFPAIPSLHYYPGLSDLPLETYRHQWESYEKRELNRLQTFAEQARQAGVQAEVTQTSGAAGHLICEIGQSWGADLICMGSRGRAGLSELLLGSVSNFVMHHAPCSVLVMKGEGLHMSVEESLPSSQAIDGDLPRSSPNSAPAVRTISQAEQERALTHLSGWQ
ncbi:Putative universal stress protein [Acaryochloris thomasi RCC1774]|uniref:Universal stress protein n=1 Tax=Acaryochloris thomasi RCC1774 TaxID=1764569 RepID=A0A2W1JMG7_9CYAN|nr:universal stress protein [Acaryochloris thomasi]PZD71344.1 Putative universal stress protein [Acaryochloris thomasi RCC1774]